MYVLDSKITFLFCIFPDIPELGGQMNPSDISRLSWSFFTLLTAACQSPDECQRYDLPLLY